MAREKITVYDYNHWPVRNVYTNLLQPKVVVFFLLSFFRQQAVAKCSLLACALSESVSITDVAAIVHSEPAQSLTTLLSMAGGLLRTRCDVADLLQGRFRARLLKSAKLESDRLHRVADQQPKIDDICPYAAADFFLSCGSPRAHLLVVGMLRFTSQI